jgi:hypothetical protein
MSTWKLFRAFTIRGPRLTPFASGVDVIDYYKDIFDALGAVSTPLLDANGKSAEAENSGRAFSGFESMLLIFNTIGFYELQHEKHNLNDKIFGYQCEFRKSVDKPEVRQ